MKIMATLVMFLMGFAVMASYTACTKELETMKTEVKAKEQQCKEQKKIDDQEYKAKEKAMKERHKAELEALKKEYGR